MGMGMKAGEMLKSWFRESSNSRFSSYGTRKHYPERAGV
jgi:hypothetical protein